jgi:opacity protein-like surface antigen
MRKILMGLAVFGAILISGIGAAAQDESKFEGFVGYSYVRFMPPSSSGVPSFGLNGGSGSISYNPVPMLGVVADIGFYHTGNAAGAPIAINLTSYMFGPKLAFPLGRFTPFAHVLLGAVHGAAAVSGGGSASGTNFTTAVGGGLDAKIAPHLSIRLIQADYMLLRSSGNTVSMPRISVGIVFRSGE